MNHDAVYALYTSVVTINDRGAFDSNSNAVVIDKEAVDSWVNPMAYSELRRAKYNLLNQDEMRFDDLVNSTTTWQDAIVAIKLEYPK